VAFEPKRPVKEINYAETRIYTDAELNNYTEEELKNFKIKHEIPMLDELEKGPWPSFVADAKRNALHRKNLADDRLLLAKEGSEDLLGLLEQSFEDGTVVSWVLWVTVVVLSAGIPTWPKNILPLLISTPCASTSQPASFMIQIS